MSKDNLKKWVCLKPFKYLDIQPNKIFLCCPSWLNIDISNNGKFNVKESWNSDSANKVRESVYNGTYKFCNHKLCPDISNILQKNQPYFEDDWISKDRFVRDKNFVPEHVLFGQDRSCNLKCPSCRYDIIVNDKPDSAEHKHKEKIQKEVENNFSKSIKIISMTGSGDPIYSKLYRDYLQNFDKTKYPNIEQIHLITNGNLLDKKMWESFNCKELISMIDISFDAGKKETYENVTRLNGDWDKLVNNLKFLANLEDNIKRDIVISFVVSELNYKEMKILVNLVDDIFEKRNKLCKSNYTINFRQIVHWETGAYSQEHIKKISIFNPEHKNHKLFLEELKKLSSLSNRITHNFHHLF